MSSKPAAVCLTPADTLWGMAAASASGRQRAHRQDRMDNVRFAVALYEETAVGALTLLALAGSGERQTRRCRGLRGSKWELASEVSDQR
jgi:hypothetical protein